ncbi:hypothetical protein Tco_0799320 [Tanacetum coccineum]|uniref:Retrotransposon gag domain-containing protein n=1 Tax=Tanacetum coccineum TaxID=301880 RepID=A0ABQ4ZTU0_9ASTR
MHSWQGWKRVMAKWNASWYEWMMNIRAIPKYHSEDGNPARANIKQALGSSQDQERYDQVGPQDTRSQDGERPQVDDHRLDLADDLKEAQDHISWTIISHKTKITTSKTAPKEFSSYAFKLVDYADGRFKGSILINRGLIQAILTSLPPQPIGEATKASNLQRIPPGVQRRSHFTYFLYLIIQIRILFTILCYPRSGSLPVSALSGTMAGVDVNTLTMEQYLALSRENQAPGVVKPEIGASLAYSIFSESLKTQSCFEFFPLLLPELQKDGYCPPSMTAIQLEDIHNFKKDGDESLCQAWERYNDLIYKCPTHDMNNYQKVNTFYKGLSTMNHQLLDSQGPILGMRPTEALTAIQTIADHSQIWHDGTTSWSIRSSSGNDGLAALVNKLDKIPQTK